MGACCCRRQQSKEEPLLESEPILVFTIVSPMVEHNRKFASRLRASDQKNAQVTKIRHHESGDVPESYI